MNLTSVSLQSASKRIEPLSCRHLAYSLVQHACCCVFPHIPDPKCKLDYHDKESMSKTKLPCQKKIFKIPRLVRNGSTMCWHQVSFFPSLFFFLSLSSIRGETLMELLHKSKYKKEKDERYNYSRQKHSRLVSLLLNTITISTVGYNTIQNMCYHHLERLWQLYNSR